MPYPLYKFCINGHERTEANTTPHKRGIKRGPTRRCKDCLKMENKSRRGYMQAWQLARKERLAGRPRPCRCEVCGNKPQDKVAVVCFDHDHESGAFRGWICNPCNVVLGRVGDNPVILDALAAYLRSKPTTVTRTKIA